MRKVVQLCSACVWLQVFCSCVKETTGSPSCDRSCVKMADRFASREYSLKNKLGDRMVKQLLNSVSAKYRDLFVTCTIKIWLVNIGKTRTFSRPAGVSQSALRLRSSSSKTFLARTISQATQATEVKTAFGGSAPTIFV